MAIVLERALGHGADWSITFPALKLGLKYGLVGPDVFGMGRANWSVAFDVHAASRGPKTGLPTLADFCVTDLMNAATRGADVTTLSRWLQRDDSADALQRVRDLLLAAPSLLEMSDEAVADLGSALDVMAQDDNLPRIRKARLAKWLSAWAPAHVPMIDRHVLDALVAEPRSRKLSIALARFKALLHANEETCASLARELSAAVGTMVTPVRVLDSLLWFDWWAVYMYGHRGRKKLLTRWFVPRTRGSHVRVGGGTEDLALPSLPPA